MYKKALLILLMALWPAATAMAQEAREEEENQPKELSGMSIIGDDETPKSLFIVPWKSSEIASDSGMDMMLTEDAVPVDRDVFMRQLSFYEISRGN